MTEQEMRQIPVSELREKLFWTERSIARYNDLGRVYPLSQQERTTQSELHKQVMLAYKILRGE